MDQVRRVIRLPEILLRCPFLLLLTLPPDSCYLTTLCVWPDYRGQGISEVMYAEAEKDIAAKFPGSRITLRTWSTNGAQEHILDKLGYSLVRRLKDDRGEGIDTVYFVKKEENDR